MTVALVNLHEMQPLLLLLNQAVVLPRRHVKFKKVYSTGYCLKYFNITAPAAQDTFLFLFYEKQKLQNVILYFSYRQIHEKIKKKTTVLVSQYFLTNLPRLGHSAPSPLVPPEHPNQLKTQLYGLIFK